MGALAVPKAAGRRIRLTLALVLGITIPAAAQSADLVLFHG